MNFFKYFDKLIYKGTLKGLLDRRIGLEWYNPKRLDKLEKAIRIIEKTIERIPKDEPFLKDIESFKLIYQNLLNFYNNHDFKYVQNLKKELPELNIEAINKREKEIWPLINQLRHIHSNITKEMKEFEKEVKKIFSEKNLSKLSMNKYIQLLQKHEGNMLTHVTRQGVRDHTGHGFHTKGHGKYFNSFIEILKSGRIYSILDSHLINKDMKKYIIQLLKLKELKNKDEALLKINRILSKSYHLGSGYSDKKAIHFSGQDVADAYYGAEESNEIFLAFPAYHILSHYYYTGKLNVGGAFNSIGASEHNDIWVWTKTKKGININSGVVFIPKNTLVDKNTGSIYKLDKNKNPVINKKRINFLRKFAKSDKGAELIKDYENIPKLSLDKKKEFNNKVRYSLKNDFGLEDDDLINLIVDKIHLFDRKRKEPKFHSSWEEILLKDKLLFLKSKELITSEKYWSNYFKENANIKPSKIVYYKEKNPTEALKKWQKRNKIKTHSEYTISLLKENNMEAHIQSYSSQKVNKGKSKFYKSVIKIINNYF